jgi:acyl dehydratase
LRFGENCNIKRAGPSKLKNITMTGAFTIKLADIKSHIGGEIFSPWRQVTQDMIHDFAKATDDHQWIHVDPVRAAAETPFGGSIAHGFLTLSLLSTLAYETLPVIETTSMGMNYGFDKIRFAAPVKAGAKVRAKFKLTDADIRPSGRVLTSYDVTLEIEGSLKPAFTAEWKTMSVIDADEVAKLG